MCIDGLEDGTEAHADVPEALIEAEEPASAPPPASEGTADTLSTGSDVLDGILHHSQARLLEGIADMGKYLDAALRAGKQPRAAPQQVEVDARLFT